MNLQSLFNKTILDAIPEGIIIQNCQNTIIFSNTAAAQIFERSPDDLYGQTIACLGLDLIEESGAHYQHENLPFSLTLETGQAQKNKLLGIVSDNGTLKWLNVSTALIEESDQRGVLISFTDCTEKIDTEESGRIHEERIKLALRSNGLGVWDLYPQEDKFYVREGWHDLFKFKKPELDLSFSVFKDMIFPDDRERVLKHLEMYLSGQISHYEQEYRVWCNSYGWRWIISRGKIVKYDSKGNPQKVTGIYKDISGRKAREVQVSLTEQKFFNAFHFSAIGMALVSPEGLWIDVNEALLKFLDYSKEELQKRSFQEVTHPDDLQADLSYVNAILNKEISSYSMEKRYIRKNGDVIWALLRVSLISDKNGEPQFFLSQIVDISFLKGLISELENKNQLLNHATVSLKNKVGQMEEFSRIVAHNLRSPVANIMTLAEMLQNEPENAVTWGTMLAESARSLDEVLHDLISIVQIRLNKDLPHTDCDISMMIGRIKLMFSNEILQSNIHIQEELQVPVIPYPKPYMDSILYNLISNAIKYRNTKKDCRIVIKTFKEGRHTVLEVQDNGLGIDLDKYGKHLFKLHKTFHRGFDSKGVGLFITKTQIESLGGRISVESESGNGSVFRVDL
ncbi:PAS domain-containing sensor histidine kinase [Pararcticibacter amylolyticus]|uniref:histidine kinase n=1 Tax=Pararcticibacter amylolyticus TaxID=2173175 RepID=A0A2U2PKR8_9SPHI|nr:PAS domain-containing sensor histidine kinase [Pararcticibacter amylolyticus]PWG81990.1 hypothetical protein DDR33_02915 [Pararcticibacter amylolyticus]